MVTWHEAGSLAGCWGTEARGFWKGSSKGWDTASQSQPPLTTCCETVACLTGTQSPLLWKGQTTQVLGQSKEQGFCLTRIALDKIISPAF